MLLLAMNYAVAVVAGELEFRCLETNNGLADSHVSAILKDRKGFLWIGTAAGLSRYDGFRFKNFYANTADKGAIRSNQVEGIVEDGDGKLWVQTNEGYSIYDPSTERFNNNVEEWMRQRGMRGTPDLVFVDAKRCFWITVKGLGCYYYNPKTVALHLFSSGNAPEQLPRGIVTCISERGTSLVLSYNDGTLVRLDGPNRRLVWVNSYLAQQTRGNKNHHYNTVIDSHYNYWVSNHALAKTMVYSSRERKWYASPNEFMRSQGLNLGQQDVFVKAIAEDAQGRLWLATEHQGLYVADLQRRQLTNAIYNAANPNTLPDNTLQSLYVDKSGGVWIGTYKNGVAYYSPSLAHFPTVPLGDICCIAVDQQGNYWYGTNDSGLLLHTPGHGTYRRYRLPQTGLGTDVVVCALLASDGTLWFGSFNGGLTHYANGSFRAFNTGNSQLANNSVWSLAEDAQGNIMLGTLGGGLQTLNPKTMQFKTYNTDNSPLPSDYVSSVRVGGNGLIYVGHSNGVSTVDVRTGKVQRSLPLWRGEEFSSMSVNDVFVDSRGLIWNANMSGLDVYDPHSCRIHRLFSHPQLGCAVQEDADGNIWATLANSVVRVKPSLKEGQWSFFTNSYDELDGLQHRRFNYRSICFDGKGQILVGGQDGVNVIPTRGLQTQQTTPDVLFSGIVLFDHPLSVGEQYNNRVILTHAVNASRELHLDYDENAFTVLLATNQVSVPQKSHFLYRLKGFGDEKWLMTVESQPSVSYAGLAPRTYTLEVKAVGRDGTAEGKTASITIFIAPPFWLSPWAYVLYVVLTLAVLWVIWRLTVHRQLEKMRLESVRKEAERNRKLDEMKLSFLTDISHELRTPLSLVISPVKAMISKEDDVQKRLRLELILRNANRLLNLVNQTLDLRKIETNAVSVDLREADMVAFVKDIVETFARLSQKDVRLSFHSDLQAVRMAFDADKMAKVMNNLLSNAFKFTPEGGAIDVTISLETADGQPLDRPKHNLLVSVADTGCGIAAVDKTRIFDRFYQAGHRNASVFGDSGLGLSIAKMYVTMHGGDISVADNHAGEGKGTVFTISLPLNQALGSIGASVSANNADCSEAMVQESPITHVPTPTPQVKKEVLVVDDSDDFLTFMTEILSEQYIVRTAVDGHEALKEVAKAKPHLILSDVMMPVMDGNELCRAIKGNPETAHIPFIMLTARLSTEHQIEGFTSGADEYITKPFNLDLLHLRIDNLIRAYANRQGDVLQTPEHGAEKLSPTITREQITSLDQQLMDKATAFVEANLGNAELSVEMMSEEMGMSRVHLYKRLLSITGNTPSEFIRLIRIRHAEQLLRESQLSVSEIAYKVGFNLPRLFSKYFKEHYGVMPSQYKLNHKSGMNA